MKATLYENTFKWIDYELGKAHEQMNVCFINSAILQDCPEEDVINDMQKSVIRCITHLEYLLKTVNELSEWHKEICNP